MLNQNIKNKSQHKNTKKKIILFSLMGLASSFVFLSTVKAMNCTTESSEIVTNDHSPAGPGILLVPDGTKVNRKIATDDKVLFLCKNCDGGAHAHVYRAIVIKAGRGQILSTRFVPVYPMKSLPWPADQNKVD